MISCYPIVMIELIFILALFVSAAVASTQGEQARGARTHAHPAEVRNPNPSQRADPRAWAPVAPKWFWRHVGLLG